MVGGYRAELMLPLVPSGDYEVLADFKMHPWQFGITLPIDPGAAWAWPSARATSPQPAEGHATGRVFTESRLGRFLPPQPDERAVSPAEWLAHRSSVFIGPLLPNSG